VTIVGFDTSLPVTAACVLRADGEAFTTPPPSPERLLGRPGHSAELLPVLAELLEQAEVDWREVRALAVGVGPGTFTGLRIGVATARGLAHGLGIGISPVSSLAALAAGLDPDDLFARLADLDPAPLAAGDWALESRSDLEVAGAIVPPADSGLHAVNALHVCRLAEAIEPLPPERVRPTYVRLPDAEINWNARSE
jgi:tRNA threonylcarbamoyladenosine biosynthesis protein TsaB